MIDKDIMSVINDAFLEYAGYNLQRRAIPDVRDGLKWGSRQILHAQYLGKLTYDKPFKKATKSVAQSMSFSYVHGSASAYGTLIRMAKPFAMQVPLQEAKGNFGSLIDPEDHSSERYVELRGSEVASYLLKDIDKETIPAEEWEDTYDLEGKFPKVLPAKGFWGGVNGCISIGSGMSCSLPPLNLREANSAMVQLLWDPNLPAESVIVLPDFPTGGTILNKDEVASSLINGTGKACRVRAKIIYSEKENCLIVKEMPYSTYTNTICRELADLLAEEGEDTAATVGIKSYADYTGENPDLRIFLQKGADVEAATRFIFGKTSLQNYYSINQTVLKDGKLPTVMGQKEMFLEHLRHELSVYRRGFNFDLKKIKKRLHIIDGLLAAVSVINDVIRLIKSSASTSDASKKLQEFLQIDEEQARAILDIKLSRLAHLEIEKLEKERDNLIKERDRLQEILSNETLLKQQVENGLQETATKFGQARRTILLNVPTEKAAEEDPIPITVGLSNEKFIYLLDKKQKLGKDEYIADSIMTFDTSPILCFTRDGKYWTTRMKGLKTRMQTDFILPFMNNRYVFFVTKKGYFSLIPSTEFSAKISVNNPAVVVSLTTDDDSIVAVYSVRGDETVGVLTRDGYFVETRIDEVRPTAKRTSGVGGIKLKKEDDYVVSARLIQNNVPFLITINKEGRIKRVVNDIGISHRNTHGILMATDAVDFLPVDENTKFSIITSPRQPQLAVQAKDISLFKRTAKGSCYHKLSKNAEVISLLFEQ